MLQTIKRIIIELGSLIFYGSCIVTDYLWWPKVRMKGKKKTPIILLHGWGSRRLSLFLLKKRFENRGYQVYIPHFGLHFRTIEELAGKLNHFVKKNKITKFTFVTHSLGGLVGLYYYLHYRNGIQKFISLGTPYHGTPMARVGFFSKSGREMLPGSKPLQKIHAHKKKLRHFISLATKHDEIVPFKSTKLKGAKNLTVDCPGHASLLYSKNVFERVVKLLE